MTNETAYQIKCWLDLTVLSASDSDFENGLALLAQVMTNSFYLQNIRNKGRMRGLSTLRYELEKSISGMVIKKPAESREQGEKKDGKDLNDNKDFKDNGEWEQQKKDKVVIREIFPFLSDPDCPEELKLMVSDMITSHTIYMQSHEQLYYVAGKSNEECFKVVEPVVEHYLNNRMIWDELHHYKKTKEILGIHPLFARRKRREEIEGLSAVELMKLYRNLPRNICYYQKLMKEDPDSEKQGERKERLEQFDFELKIVRRLLQIDEVKVNRKKKAKAKKKGVKR